MVKFKYYPALNPLLFHGGHYKKLPIPTTWLNSIKAKVLSFFFSIDSLRSSFIAPQNGRAFRDRNAPNTRGYLMALMSWFWSSSVFVSVRVFRRPSPLILFNLLRVPSKLFF